MFVRKIIKDPIVLPNIDKGEQEYLERMKARKHTSRNSILGFSKLGNVIGDLEGSPSVSHIDNRLIKDQSLATMGSFQSS
jgi:hypothetical protein